MQTRTRALSDQEKLQAGEYLYFKNLLELYPSGILSVVSDTFNLWSALTLTLPLLKEQILARDGKLVIRPDSGDPVDIICGTNSQDKHISFKHIDTHDTIELALEAYVNRISYFAGEDEYPTYNAHISQKAIIDGQCYLFEVKEFKDKYPANKSGCYLNQITPVYSKSIVTESEKGVIELLWDVFGGTINEQGYKVLDPHIGAIYGDSITIERAEAICERLKAKGFASTNIVFGIGSFTYQYNTRDTFGFAMKATYGEITKEAYFDDLDMSEMETPHLVIEQREIFKDPITDDGTKRSKKGLLVVKCSNVEERRVCDACEYPAFEANITELKQHTIYVEDQQTWEQEQTGLLTTVFKDGKLVKRTTLDEIRTKLKNS